MDKWREETWYNIHNGLLLGHKQGNLPFATAWRDLEGIMPSDVSQTEKDTHQLISFICRTNQPNKRTPHRHREHTGGFQKVGIGSGQNGWGRGFQRYHIPVNKINKFWGSNVQHKTYT